MKKTKILLSLILVIALIVTTIPFCFAETEILNYSENFEEYEEGALLYDYRLS